MSPTLGTDFEAIVASHVREIESSVEHRAAVHKKGSSEIARLSAELERVTTATKAEQEVADAELADVRDQAYIEITIALLESPDNFFVPLFKAVHTVQQSTVAGQVLPPCYT